jgi:hypothetical protein
MTKRASLVGLALLLLVPAAPAPRAWAGPNPDFKIFLHLVPVSNQRGLTCFSHIPKDSTSVVVAGGLYPQNYIAYVLVSDFSAQRGVAGVQFGVSYDDSVESGVDILSWQSCALLEWAMDAWPAANTGNLLTWNQAEDCQEKWPLPVGYFYLTAYSPDRLKIIPRPVDNLARIAVCGLTNAMQSEKDLVDNATEANMGWVDFGGGKGYNPWDPAQNLKNIKARIQR